MLQAPAQGYKCQRFRMPHKNYKWESQLFECTSMNEGRNPDYNEPKCLLCIQPFHSSLWSRFKKPMSLSVRLTVANPTARLARHKHPKIHGSNCFCSFSQNPVLSAIYIKAIAPLMITGARVCCPVRKADSLPFPGFAEVRLWRERNYKRVSPGVMVL